MSLDKIFKAYDIRGLVPEELNPDIAREIGRALAVFLSEETPGNASKSVVVGHDMRADSHALAAALIEGLTKVGRDVISIGLISTDMLYFAVAHLDAAGGAVVTASHNPGSYNGIKLCREKAIPIGADSGLGQVQARVAAGSPSMMLGVNGQLLDNARSKQADIKKGSVTEKDIMDEWVEHALAFADDIKPYRMAVDAGNGMAGLVIPHLEGKTPLRITPMYFELDGSFPNHEANPMKIETLQNLCQRVKSDDIDFGLAFDGDGDRMALVDELGRSVDGSTAFALLAWHTLDKYPGAKIVHDLRMSRSALEFITKKGGNLVRSKVGNPSIKQAMRDHGAPLGGETTGHFVLSDNLYIDSGLVAALVAIGTLSVHDMRLCDFVDQITAYVRPPETNFEVRDKAAAIERLAKEFSDGKQDRLDGLTVNYDDWWFNVRPSNTEPLLRLNIEARSQVLLDEKQALLQHILTGKNTSRE